MSLDRRTFLKLPALTAIPFGVEGAEYCQFDPKDHYGNSVNFFDHESKVLDALYSDAVNSIPPGYRDRIRFSVLRTPKNEYYPESPHIASWVYKP